LHTSNLFKLYGVYFLNLQIGGEGIRGEDKNFIVHNNMTNQSRNQPIF